MSIFNEFNKKEKPIFTGSRMGFGRSPMLAAAAATSYSDPDAANLYFAYAFDNTNQANDVQNIIRAANGVSNGTLRNATKGSAASFSSTQNKFYTHSLYTGDNFDNGHVKMSHTTAGVDFYRLKVPFTIQFWVYYNDGPFNNFPSESPGDMGAVYEPASGRSGWKLSIHHNRAQIYGYYSGDTTRTVNTNTVTNSSGEWMHWAFAVSGGETASRVYKNGTLLSNNSDSIKSHSVGDYASTANNSSTIYVAGRGTDYTYDSRKDFSDAYYQDVKFYTTARSQANIQAEYNFGLPIIDA
tara:strand:+ start:57 stop:947 length:891 start_codon:yes stop_codon:yes gene_type:complete